MTSYHQLNSLFALMEYTMDDLFMMFKKWIVALGDNNELKGQEILRQIIDYLENKYNSITGNKLKIHYLIRILVVLRDMFPDGNTTVEEVKKWENSNNVLKTFADYEEVMKSRKILKIALTYIPFVLREISGEIFDDAEYYRGHSNEDEEFDEEEVMKVLEGVHQIKTADKFYEFLRMVKYAKKMLKNYEKYSELKVFEKNNNATVYYIENYYHSVVLGKGSMWCITQTDHYVSYARQCDLYVIIPKDPVKYVDPKAGNVSEKYALAINRELNNISNTINDIVETIHDNEIMEGALREYFENGNPNYSFYLNVFYPLTLSRSFGFDVSRIVEEMFDRNINVNVADYRNAHLFLYDFSDYLKNSFNEYKFKTINIGTHGLREVFLFLLTEYLDKQVSLENVSVRISKGGSRPFFMINNERNNFDVLLMWLYWLIFGNYQPYLDENVKLLTAILENNQVDLLFEKLNSYEKSFIFRELGLESVIDELRPILSDDSFILYELNNEKNERVESSVIENYISNKEFWKRIKKAEKTFKDFTYYFNSEENINSSKENLLVEAFSNFISYYSALYNKDSYYKTLLDALGNFDNYYKNIHGFGNIALSIFREMSSEDDALIENICRLFRDRLSEETFTYEKFPSNDVLNKYQKILSGEIK
ncbi:MAG: hypothetical protein N3A54_00020 [Patescibacteria group bacterium]|nr:hypothetical protein [Patescibacteria group bacterium]